MAALLERELSASGAPATVRSGDVYLVLEIPDGTSVDVVKALASAGGAPGPLSDADLARFRSGDGQGFSNEIISVGGDAGMRTANLGRTGLGGNVFKESLAAGQYVLVIGSEITVLTAVP